METLQWEKQFGDYTLSIELNKDSLHPIGYKAMDDSIYPILLGGRMYLFDGIVSLHCKNKSGCALEDVTINASCRMLYGDDSSELVISSVSQSLDHDSTVFGRTEIPFSLEVSATIDSYSGKLASVAYMITASVELEYVVIDFSVPFFVYFPMPLPPVCPSVTATLKMYDILEFEIHLDRTVFTVNDIITGWIRIIQAKKQIPGLSLALRASERLISLDSNDRRSGSTASYQSQYFEIMDTIYPCSSEEDDVRTHSKEITMTASTEVWKSQRYDRIPFRTFIRDSTGTSPSYSLLNDQLSVDWQIVIAINDKSKTQ